MNRFMARLKWKAWLNGIAAFALTLASVPLTLFSLAASYDLVQARLAGRAAFGKDVVVIPLLVASLWLLKLSWELWRKSFTRPSKWPP